MLLSVSIRVICYVRSQTPPPLLKGGVKRCPVDIEAGGGKVSR